MTRQHEPPRKPEVKSGTPERQALTKSFETLELYLKVFHCV